MAKSKKARRSNWRDKAPYISVRRTGGSNATHVHGDSCHPPTSEVKFLTREVIPMEPKLESDIWSRGLPDDVYCTILAKLPLSSFSRLRTVCKSWNAMPKDKNFLEACSRGRPQDPSLVLKSNDNDVYWNYEPMTDSWKPMPYRFFHPKDYGVRSSAKEGIVSYSAKGIVLLLRGVRLFLLNPLNRSLKLLPPMRDMTRDETDYPTTTIDLHVIGMFVNDGAKEFNILVMNKRTNADEDLDFEYDDIEPFVSQVFNSRASCWNLVKDFYPLMMLDSVSIASASMDEKKLWCMLSTPKSKNRLNDLTLYSVEPNAPSRWADDCPQLPRENLRLVAPYLFTYRGKLMLVAALPTIESQNQKFPTWNNVIIWELDDCRATTEGRWTKLFEIDPQESNNHIWNTSSKSFFFQYEGECIYFGSKSGSTLGMINLRSQTWRLLPTFPGFIDFWVRFGQNVDQLCYETFLYEPRFDLVV